MTSQGTDRGFETITTQNTKGTIPFFFLARTQYFTHSFFPYYYISQQPTHLSYVIVAFATPTTQQILILLKPPTDDRQQSFSSSSSGLVSISSFLQLQQQSEKISMR